MTSGDLAITAQERTNVLNGNLEAFWRSRLSKKDPVARIGYALWVTDTAKLKHVIQSGDTNFWNNKGFTYWEFMARSTVVNLATGLERGGFRGTFSQMRAKIKDVGIEVANQHISFVTHDYDNGNIGEVKGLLSRKQMADYHHIAFKLFNIPNHFYGGTWLNNVPDEAGFTLYGELYCHDCDSAVGYKGANQ
jgi:hypothetical protein